MVKITTLVDNHALPVKDLEAEHGFSCLVEVGAKRILFDTGTGKAFIRNAQRLGVDLSNLDDVVISHAHYDHGGGLVPLLETFSYPLLTLWTGKGFEDKKYADDPDGLRYLGPGFDRSNAEQNNVLWHTVCSDTVMIHPGIWLVSAFDRIHPFEQPNPRFLVEHLQEKVVDDFCDEVSMVIDSPRGLVMIAGCSHPGILNMIDSVRSRFPKPLYALIGGIHLYDAAPERRDAVVHQLIAQDIPLLGVSHCTGDEASAILKERFPGYFANMAGTVTTII
jgi:7,8-dihydropterin-6-yl-methyl-4-(beta-D-ribofuranosyl)aminobenzene 5'-phosphate synthase